METAVSVPLLKLPEPSPDHSARERQAGPKGTERYSAIWKRRNGIAPVGAIETPPAERAPVPVTAVWRQRAATRLHALGARPVLEALIEVADGKPLDSVLADFARLDPTIVRAFGGDAFPSAVFAVAGR